MHQITSLNNQLIKQLKKLDLKKHLHNPDYLFFFLGEFSNCNSYIHPNVSRHFLVNMSYFNF